MQFNFTSHIIYIVFLYLNASFILNKLIKSSFNFSLIDFILNKNISSVYLSGGWGLNLEIMMEFIFI